MSKRWDRSQYPDDWGEISRHAKERAGWCCVGSPAFPTCRARHGEPHPVTGSIVVLTTAHRDHNPNNNSNHNLAVWCQRCHLNYDAEEHLRHAAATRWAQLCEGQGNLFEGA
jgi:hypothetical protein